MTERVRIVEDAGPVPFSRRGTRSDPWVQNALLALKPGSAAAFSTDGRNPRTVQTSIGTSIRYLIRLGKLPPGSVVTRIKHNPGEVWAYRLADAASRMGEGTL